jgi:MerR family transcriptional regulator/heat shock protein HspR
MSVAVSLTGVDAYRIRRYEAVGLVRPGRTEGGRRLFSDREVARIREVARLEAEGVNLRGIEVILRMKGGAQAEGGNERNR